MALRGLVLCEPNQLSSTGPLLFVRLSSDQYFDLSLGHLSSEAGNDDW
jgi:hypothetical protein